MHLWFAHVQRPNVEHLQYSFTLKMVENRHLWHLVLIFSSNEDLNTHAGRIGPMKETAICTSRH